MSKQKWKGGALIAPLPAVLVSCKGKDREGKEAENIFTVAWTGIVNTVPPKTYISVRKSRYSYDIIKNSGEFVLNIPTSKIVRELDYCGIYTGGKVDKFEKCGFTKEASNEVSAPCIGECPLSLECRVTDITELGTHDMFIADILCTNVNDELIDKEGKLRLDKAGLMAFAHGEYYSLGKRIGEFGFSTKKKGKVGIKHDEKEDGRKITDADSEVRTEVAETKPVRKKENADGKKSYSQKNKDKSEKYGDRRDTRGGKYYGDSGYTRRPKADDMFRDTYEAYDADYDDFDIDDDVLNGLGAKMDGKTKHGEDARSKKAYVGTAKGGKGVKSGKDFGTGRPQKDFKDKGPSKRFGNVKDSKDFKSDRQSRDFGNGKNAKPYGKGRNSNGFGDDKNRNGFKGGKGKTSEPRGKKNFK